MNYIVIVYRLLEGMAKLFFSGRSLVFKVFAI